MASTPNRADRNRQRKSPRPKHVPQRTCISCRQKGDKRGLIRIVRTPEHLVEIDPTGKRNGRGAYLCHQERCWDRALSGTMLGKALNTELPDDTRQELKTFAATLGDDAEARIAENS